MKLPLDDINQSIQPTDTVSFIFIFSYLPFQPYLRVTGKFTQSYLLLANTFKTGFWLKSGFDLMSAGTDLSLNKHGTRDMKESPFNVSSISLR